MKKILLISIALLLHSISNAQIVNIPDANFKAYLVNNNAINTNGDTEIQVSEAYNFTGTIYVSNSNISSLTGIEYFLQLTKLYCSGNQLTSLNVSDIVPLTTLSCSYNQLTYLNIGHYTALSVLNCSNNQLTSLDVTYNTHLSEINCDNNQLSVLNTENLSSLIMVSCSNNQINVLDMTYKYHLESLYCSNNNLTSLDVSQSHDLTWLDCSNNQITSLNITGLTNLATFIANNNLLTILNVSSNSGLAILNVANNQLTYLNARNNGNFDFEIFDARQNLLSCIEVDDAAWSAANWANIDDYVYFSETPCQPCEISIPDVNFKTYLITNPLINVNGDGEIQCAEAHYFNGTININSLNVADMTGIEEFYDLTVLRCNDNQIPTIDLSNNNNLTYLDIRNNNLTNIDVTNNPDLATIFVQNNNLSSLDISNNLHLNHLRCDNNSINNLDISNNTSLITLNCTSNNLNALNVLNNPALTSINCKNNQIEILKVVNNPLLNSLDCKNNQIVDLDLTNNSVLTYLRCQDNDLVALDVTNGNNTNFTYFNAINNPNLTCIQVDDAAWSTANWTNIDTQSSFGVNCSAPKTYVPDDNFEQALIDLGYDTAMDNFVFTANINTITSLNVSNKNIADLTGIEDFLALVNLNCSNNQLTTLTIINDLDNLDNLNCNFNQITSLDVEDNVVLTVLACRANQLTTIDVYNNTYLQFFSCRDNLLTELDVSNNPDLVRLWCFNNQLTSLNVKNGANTNIANSNFNAINNPNLTCIEVDNATWSTTNWTNIDAIANYTDTTCELLTYVPDDNFEQALIDLGYDSGALDDYVPTANINTITHLTLNFKNISDLTGIEDFAALINLQCDTNNLVTVNLSQNTNLKYLNIRNNQLNSIDLTQNTQLTSVTIANNQLTSLDLSYNTVLNGINLSNNQLSTLDISNNTILKNLTMHTTQISSLDISQNPLLERFDIRNSLFTSLDLSQHSAVTYLKCNNNQLTDLNVKNGNNTNFTVFETTSNPNLTCIEVDDATWSATNWTNIDATSTFVNNQAACNSLAITENSLEKQITIFPNPAANSIHIQNNGNLIINKLSLYNSLGKRIYQSNHFQENLDLSTFSNGIYILKLSGNNQVITKKISISK